MQEKQRLFVIVENIGATVEITYVLTCGFQICKKKNVKPPQNCKFSASNNNTVLNICSIVGQKCYF